MPQPIREAAHPALSLTALIVGLLLLVPAWAAAADRTLKIDTRHVTDVQFMPDEISGMLEDLGYHWVPVHDPAVGRGVKMAEQQGQYRMQFEADDAPGILVEVHIRSTNGVTGLHFRHSGSETPAATAAELFRKLKERAELEFGADNVSETHSFFTP